MHMEQGSDSVEFYIGALSEKLPAKQFEDMPVCKSNACRGGASVESMRQKKVDGVGNWKKDKVCRCFYLAITWGKLLSRSLHKWPTTQANICHISFFLGATKRNNVSLFPLFANYGH